MKFSEIKHKIKNLGNFQSLEEIKKAGLRIVRNTKTGDYWLIEEEFLKPVVKSPKECKSILIKPQDLKYKVLIVHKSKKELKGTKVLDYIEWGEKQGFHKRPTCKGREKWWELEEPKISLNILPMFERERKYAFLNWGKSVYIDATFYWVYPNKNFLSDYKYREIILNGLLNSTLRYLLEEILARPPEGGGGGPIQIKVIDYLNFYVPIDFKFKKDVLEISYDGGLVIKKDFYNILGISENDLNDFLLAISRMASRSIQAIFTELGFDPSKPIREQEPNPLPDRKVLDDIIFDALGLTEEERKEVYWAVGELVNNRLEKAKSV
jgi:hypothetical protein